MNPLFKSYYVSLTTKLFWGVIHAVGRQTQWVKEDRVWLMTKYH